MNDTIIPITNEIINYLLVASMVAVSVTPLVWAIIKLLKVRAPIYRHMIWLYTLSMRQTLLKPG